MTNILVSKQMQVKERRASKCDKYKRYEKTEVKRRKKERKRMMIKMRARKSKTNKEKTKRLNVMERKEKLKD